MVYTSKIIRISDETQDTRSFFFEKPRGFIYSAGQYCIFETKQGDEIIRRSYSLSSSPTEDSLRITVRHIPQGKMTTYLFGLQAGDSLVYNGAFGKFNLSDEFTDVVLIAGGTGISPFRAMSKYASDKNLPTKVTVIYGSRTPKDIIFHDELESFLANQRFKLYLTIDKPEPSWKFHVGFINLDFIKEATNGLLLNKIYFLCGPPVMLTSVKDSLMKEGVPESKIEIDAWG